MLSLLTKTGAIMRKELIGRIEKRFSQEALSTEAYDGELLTLLSDCQTALSQQSDSFKIATVAPFRDPAFQLGIIPEPDAVLYEGQVLYTDLATSYQQRVAGWMQQCFRPEISSNKRERAERFLEEALELAQACGLERFDVSMLADYTFNRPVGDINQEIGGVMVTLSALGQAHNINIQQCAETELDRVWTKIDVIREKQKTKPALSPLPGVYPEREAPTIQHPSSDSDIQSDTFDIFVAPPNDANPSSSGWDSPVVEKIVTEIYKRFKDWQKRRFSADDVTWCEVRKNIAEIINAVYPTREQVATPFSATWNSTRQKIKNTIRQYRHNNDASPNLIKPEKGFVFGYDAKEVEEILDSFEATLSSADQDLVEFLLETQQSLGSVDITNAPQVAGFFTALKSQVRELLSRTGEQA